MTNSGSITLPSEGQRKWLRKGDNAQARQKRYTLVVPEDLFNEVEQLAAVEQTSVVELLRRFIKLGLLVTDVQRQPNGAVILKEGDSERELIIL